MRQREKYFLTATVVLFWIIAVASKLKYNGLMYGLDFGLYHPDGSLYDFKTLTLMGHSQADAGIQVSHWYSSHSFKLKSIDPSSLWYSRNVEWSMYGLRILYPILSIPFVALLGLSGMLVVPAISLLTLMTVCTLIGSHFSRPWVGAGVGILFSFSITVDRWMLINTTDSVLVALSSLVVLVLIKNPPSKFWYPIMGILLIASNLTRFVTLLWLAIALVIFIRERSRVRVLFISMISALFFLPLLFRHFSDAVLPVAGNKTLVAKALAIPVYMVKVGIYEIGELAVLDRWFLILLIVTIVLAARNWRNLESQYFLLSLFALWVTGAINGTIGVNFRYELPILPFVAWVLVNQFKWEYPYSGKNVHSSSN